VLSRLLFTALTTAALAACNGCSPAPELPPPTPAVALRLMLAAPSTIVPATLAQRPQDPTAFTQGLLFDEGVFFESTGVYGESSLRRVDPSTGKVLKVVHLPPDVFGEGLARLHGELFQLTWRERRCLVYDEATFEKRRELTYDGEGWGLTGDGEAMLVLSDGSDALRFLDPVSFAVVRTLAVHDGGRPLQRLNELEWVRGEILANVWETSIIVRIDPHSGGTYSPDRTPDRRLTFAESPSRAGEAPRRNRDDERQRSDEGDTMDARGGASCAGGMAGERSLAGSVCTAEGGRRAAAALVA
jgi:glutamine cyclotransferase